MSDSIQGGSVVKPYWLFFPHNVRGALFPDEDAVRGAVPQYFAKDLVPNRARLASRRTIIRSRRSDWWGLEHHCRWSVVPRPRILTKFFGAEGAFVGDYDATFCAVMGDVWSLKQSNSPLFPQGPDPDLSASDDQLMEADLLAAYVGLCNSVVFAKLLGFYAPHVAGGQYDLSSRHVFPIPMPDLKSLAIDPVRGHAVRKLEMLGRQVDLPSSDWRR